TTLFRSGKRGRATPALASHRTNKNSRSFKQSVVHEGHSFSVPLDNVVSKETGASSHKPNRSSALRGRTVAGNAKCERRRGDRTVNLNVALHRSLMALSVISLRRKICRLLDQQRTKAGIGPR